jgi:hypothetical protein
MHDTKAYRVMEAALPSFLTSALDGGKWSASSPVFSANVPELSMRIAFY